MSPALAARFGALIAAAALSAARLFSAAGTVFDDQNGDGRRDPGEPGLASVGVSNGADVTLTDANGSYSLPDRPGQSVFVIKPRGWSPPLTPDNRPRFHGPAGASADFGLHRAPEPDFLKVVVLTDPQPATPTEVGYLERGIIDRIPRDMGATLGVTLGDVVYDRPDLFSGVNAAISKLGLPWYSVPGNHDLALGTPDETAAAAPFESVFGPSSFAFHAGPVLFIGLDDVRPLGGPRYIGGLREDQFTFVGNVLKISPPSEWIVLMFHIPLFSPDPSGTEGFRKADRLRLFSLLQDRPHVLILSGHTHYQRHVLYGPDDGWKGTSPLHEFNVAAACGGFWGGPKDAQGIPVSTMWDGTPPGYALLAFAGDGVSLDYYPARFPADHQIGLHAPAVIAPRQGYVSFYVNVFNGHDGWNVEARVDDRAWNPIRRILGWDPSYAAAFLAQDAVTRPASGTRLPDPVVCYHLWRGILPADLSLGTHRLQVRATDPRGRVFAAEQAIAIANP